MAFSFSSVLHGHSYSLIDPNKEDGERPRGCLVRQRARHSKPLSTFSLLLACFVLAIVSSGSFYAGRHFVTDGAGHNIDLRSVSQVFLYNRTFGQQSTNATVRAWEELFPEQGGFFKHPTIAPQRSAFSVFHQLHCLNSIREGFWSVYQAAIEGRKIVEDDMPMMSSTPHIRHCIDLLRHTLMCQPDTTIEVKDEEIGGVKGFGTEHQCKDWEQLMQWTRDWQTYDQTPKETDGQVQAHHHKHGANN